MIVILAESGIHAVYKRQQQQQDKIEIPPKYTYTVHLRVNKWEKRSDPDIVACGYDFDASHGARATRQCIESASDLERIKEQPWFLKEFVVCPACDEKRDILLLKDTDLE